MGVNSVTQQKDLHFKFTTERIQYSLAMSCHIFSKTKLSDILRAPENEKDAMVSFSKLKYRIEGQRTKTLMKTLQ